MGQALSDDPRIRVLKGLRRACQLGRPQPGLGWDFDGNPFDERRRSHASRRRNAQTISGPLDMTQIEQDLL